MKKRMKIRSLFTCIVAFIATLLLSVCTYVFPVRAAGGEVFAMEYGAGIQLSKNGLRFKAKMDQAYYDMLVTNDPQDNVQLYGYVAPVEEFDKIDYLGGEYASIAIKVGGVLDEDKIYQENGYYYANIVITKLDENELNGVKLYDKTFSAFMYIQEGTGTRTYAQLAEDKTNVENIAAQARTQYEIVLAAMLDAEESYEERIMSAYGNWLGDAEHPIVLDTEEKIAAFAEKLENSSAFAEKVNGKNVFVKEGLSSDTVTDHVEVTEQTGHVVKFYDGNRLVDMQFVQDGQDAAAPADPTRDGFDFVEWVGSTENITADQNVYAKWKFAKGDVKTLDSMSLYGATLGNGGTIDSKSDVLGQKVILASGDLGDGAYYPGTTDDAPNPTDKSNTADQAYLAFDGSYGFNDYFVADFTGKNMPTMAFFANNYTEGGDSKSIFYGDGNKNGVVVATGLTWPDGRLFTEGVGNDGKGPYCTSVWDGAGLAMWGPHMIYNTGKNAADTKDGVLLHSNQPNVALGRANLVDGKHYRIIMGFQPGDDLSNKAIKLVYGLYDLDLNELVESQAINTYNFFADGWANDGQTRDEFCSGSIVAYGYFGTTTVLDKVYDIYEDTTIDAIAKDFNLPTAYNATLSGDTITLEAGVMGNPTDGYYGPNANDNGYQGYYALNGKYSFDDYIVFDFTGKNMPEVAFFAKNYDAYMYSENGGKNGVVVASGIMTWDGSAISPVGGSGTNVVVSGPYMANFGGSGEGWAAKDISINIMDAISAKLARANLVDDKHYRVIMGFTKASESAITLKYALYDLDTNTIVEEISQQSWAVFNNASESFYSDSTSTLFDDGGAIVLYGKFANVATTIDKMWGVYENTTIADIKAAFDMDLKTVAFQDWDGTLLEEYQLSVGTVPEFMGNYPVRYPDAVCQSYTFTGWDKELTSVTENVTYTATYTGTKRDDVTVSTSKGVSFGDDITLAASSLGNGANYTVGQNNGGYVDQSYLALDGDYALNDYIAFDFTGKNLPEIAFFAKNYNNSMYAEDKTKQGIVVVTGILTWDGSEIVNLYSDKTAGTYINYGFPYMIQDASSGAFCSGAFKTSALGRANLVDGTHYRIIMGFTEYGTSAIQLNWYLYDLDTATVVEEASMYTWNFFTGSNEQVGNMKPTDLAGSIVLYGKFGVETKIDKLHGVFEDTDIATVASALNGDATYTVSFVDENGELLEEHEVRAGTTAYYLGVVPTKEGDWMYGSYEFSGWDKVLAPVVGDITYTAKYAGIDKLITSHNTDIASNVILNSSSIGDNAHYSGSNNQNGVIGTVNQSYLAFDGNYSFNDYVAFDFTGQNMPSVAFFANNYNESMYYQNGDKFGLVVLTGLTTWQGVLYTEYNDSKSIWDGKGLAVAGPYMLHNTLTSGKNGILGFQAVSSNSGSNNNVALGRANLVEGKQYRLIMGMEKGDNAASVKIVYYLYDLDNEQVVEYFSAETYNFFTEGFVKDGESRDQSLQGSIVLYGHFGTATTLDKVWGVYEDTTIEEMLINLEIAENQGEEGGEDVPVDDGLLGYGSNTAQFDFYAYSSYSDGTYEIDGQKYYIGKSLANLKQYAQYGEVGMTIYFPQNDCLIDGSAQSLAKAKALLDDLAKVGIHKTILQDSRILYLSVQESAIVGSGCTYATEEDLDAYIYDCLEDYATHPGVYGVQLGDEPKYSMLSAYAAVYNSIKRVSEKNGWNLHIQYNLNPLNYTQVVYDQYYPTTSGTYNWSNYRYIWNDNRRFEACITRYTQYINDFLNAMNPDSIMYDDYPLMEDKNGKLVMSQTYIPCLQIVAKAAADRNIAFYNVTQAYENNADGIAHRRQMTEAGAKWLNNILVGFGAKQIAYYTYYTRGESDSTGGESYVDGSSFVDYNGNPTYLYDIMKGIMADNQIFAKVVLNFTYQGSRYYSGSSVSSDKTHVNKITTANGFTRLSGFSVNKELALVTELRDKNNDNYMYMAMNISNPDVGTYTQNVSLTFNGYTKALVYRDGVFENVELSGGIYTATLNAGDAVYVIPYN